MKEAANSGKGKTPLISAGIEIMLIICITAANLNPTPILYFIFYNLLYGLVFSLLIPLYCLYKETFYGHSFMPGSAVCSRGGICGCIQAIW